MLYMSIASAMLHIFHIISYYVQHHSSKLALETILQLAVPRARGTSQGTVCQTV